MTTPGSSARLFSWPDKPFPLIRFLSAVATPVLLRLPVSANQITSASLVFGIWSAWLIAEGDPSFAVAGALLLVACYVLDNCDGEVARRKNQCSNFGMRFDSFTDWVVHTAFFLSLGIGVSAHNGGEGPWFWLGLVAGAGGTINYLLGFLLEAWESKQRETETARQTIDTAPRGPQGLGEWTLYAFRELTRADFCFIVLALAMTDSLWLLLPAGAIGAQAYWVALFIRAARQFHV